MSARASNVRRCRFNRVVMKGKMTVEGEVFYFALKGRAFRLCISRSEPLVKPEEVAVTDVSI